MNTKRPRAPCERTSRPDQLGSCSRQNHSTSESSFYGAEQMAKGVSMIMQANKRHETQALVGCILWKCNEPARADHGRKGKLAPNINQKAEGRITGIYFRANRKRCRALCGRTSWPNQPDRAFAKIAQQVKAQVLAPKEWLSAYPLSCMRGRINQIQIMTIVSVHNCFAAVIKCCNKVMNCGS